MKNKKLYIIGSGGFGREVAWLVDRINEKQVEWDLQGFIDDNPEKIGKQEDGYLVLGGCDYLHNIEEEAWVVCAIGSSRIRKLVIDKLEGCDKVHFATLIDPSVIMSSRVSVGEGSIICAGSILTVDITVGKHVIINWGCTVGHDTVLEDFVILYPGVNVSGNVLLEREVEIGTGSQIIQGKKVLKGTIVGAGAVVVNDLPANCTAVGVPAEPIKFRE